MTQSTDRAPALVAEDVHVQFGPAWAVRGAWLRVDAGACMALVGESGAGKSSLLRAFNRMVVPSAGRVRLDGTDIATLDVLQLRRRTAYIAQDGGLLPHWSVERNVALTARLRGHAHAEQRAVAALEQVELDPRAMRHRLPHELSGGQRQRAALARALAADQPLWLLDEPFGALDRLNRDALQHLLASVHAARGMTVLLVTHDLGEAARLGSQIAVMRAGTVEQCDTLECLMQSPANDYIAQLFSSPDRTVRRG